MQKKILAIQSSKRFDEFSNNKENQHK